MPSRIYPKLHDGPNFIFNEALFPANTYYVNINPDFWDWSSNMFTLDNIVVDAYATIFPSPAIIPAPVFIGYHPPTASAPAAIVIELFALLSVYTRENMPPGDPSYWLPT